MKAEEIKKHIEILIATGQFKTAVLIEELLQLREEKKTDKETFASLRGAYDRKWKQDKKRIKELQQRNKELEEFINWIIFDADNDDILEQALKIRTWKHKDFTEPMRNQNENKSNDKRP